jgi:hypothetical protein
MKKLIPPEQQKAMKAYMMEKIAEYDTAGPEGLPEPDGLCHELPDEVYSTQSQLPDEVYSTQSQLPVEVYSTQSQLPD